MLLSREIDIKLCQIYTKIYIYKVLYKSSMFKWIIFSKYTTNLKTAISQRSLRIRNLAFLLFLVIFIKDINDNIIYMFLSRDTNSHQWQSSLLVTLYRRSHVILILHCHWWEFWSHDKDVFIILSIISVKNEKLLNSNNNRSNLSFLDSFRILLF